MGASQSSYEDEYDENENGADEMENNEMPVKISDALLSRMSHYVEEKTGKTEVEEEEEEPTEDTETEEENNPDYFQEVMGIINNVQIPYEETESEQMEQETESMLDTHDTESVEEDEMISSIDSVIDRTSNEVAIDHVKEKPCEKEMNLFSECLTQGNKCDEFEDSYFKCIESMH
ncbi:hypothetical protein WA171_005742 [Blastocystis sp. BT1]